MNIITFGIVAYVLGIILALKMFCSDGLNFINKKYYDVYGINPLDDPDFGLFGMITTMLFCATIWPIGIIIRICTKAKCVLTK